jgi:biopolymer transport protein ExbD
MPPKILARTGLALLALSALLWSVIAHLVNAWILEPRYFGLWGPTLDSPEVYGLIQYFFLCIVGSGLILLLRATWQWLKPQRLKTGSLRMLPEMKLKYLPQLQRHRRTPLFAEVPHFGLYVGTILTLLVFIHMVFRPIAPQGLLIELQERSVAAWGESSQAETLGVYVDQQGHFFVNGGRVKREKLQEKLQQELGRRTAWVVYLEAERESAFEECVYAMDAIRGAGAKVIWITPGMRQQWKNQQRVQSSQ